MHHEFAFTKGIVAEYSHPLEAMVCNILPTFSGGIIWYLFVGKVHIMYHTIYFGYRLFGTTELHSGFAFPITSSIIFPANWGDYGAKHGISQQHYFHHSHNTGNYGSPFMDSLFRTDAAYVKYVDDEIVRRKEKIKES